MPLMTFKPTSAGRRSAVRVVTPDLHKGAPYAPLLEKQGKTGGRNHHGRITTRHTLLRLLLATTRTKLWRSCLYHKLQTPLTAIFRLGCLRACSFA